MQVAQGSRRDFCSYTVDVRVVLYPGVVEGIQGADSVVWVELKQLADQILGVSAHTVPLWLVKGVLARKHRLNDFLVVLPVKRWVSAEQDIQDHSATPKVTLVIIVLLENFRGDVVRSTVLLRHFLAWNVRSRRSEIDNGDARLVAGAVKEQILGLEISVNNVATVAVVDRRKYLLDDVGCVLLAEILFLSDLFEKFSSIA